MPGVIQNFFISWYTSKVGNDIDVAVVWYGTKRDRRIRPY